MLGTYIAESIKASINVEERGMELVFEGKGGYKLERESAKDKLVVGRKYTVEKLKLVLVILKFIYKDIRIVLILVCLNVMNI